MRSSRIEIFRAARFVCLVTLLGCAASAQNQMPPVSAPASEPAPRVVTDLLSLSSQPAAPGLTIAPPAEAATRHSASSGASGATTDSDLRRLFLEQPSSGKFAGTAKTPGEERLLNAKAAQFSQFSNVLLHQVFLAAQNLERGQIAKAVLPEKLDPVIITARMSKDGKLEELVLEQPSGSGLVDHLMIDACKQGLWTSNPPPEALSSGGDYKVRIEGRLKNFNTFDNRYWNFETRIGLALL